MLIVTKTGVQAQQLSEEAEAIKRDMRRLNELIEDIDDTWSTLKDQISYAYDNSIEMNQKFVELQNELQRIADRSESQEISTGD